MSILDIAVIGIVGLSGLLAFFRGMMKEFFSLLGWVAGGLAVLFGLPYVRPMLEGTVDLGENTGIILDVAAGIAIFVIVMIVVALFTNAISEKVRESSFGTLDRSLGLLFGLVRGFVLVSLFYILLIMAFSGNNEPDWMRTAQTRPALAIGGCLLLQLAPESFGDTRQEVCDPEAGSRQDPGERRQGERGQDSGTETGYTRDQREGLDRRIEQIR